MLLDHTISSTTVQDSTVQDSTVQDSTLTVPLEALRACRSRNALLTYTVLSILGGALSLHDTLAAITLHAHLSRSAAYRALHELRTLGLVEHNRHGYKVCAQPCVAVAPLRRTSISNLKRVTK